MYDPKKPNFVVNIHGGAGKNILFTGVAKNIKATYPDHNLIVITPYIELLINVPFIDRVYKSGITPYLYDDIVSTSKDNICYSVDPYNDNGYLNEREHLIQTWSRALNVNTDMQLPEMHLTYREIENFNQTFLQEIIKAGGNKPILVIQPFGGPENNQKYNWCRDIPVRQAQELTDRLSENYVVVQIAKDTQTKLERCVHFSSGLRDIACLLQVAKKRILIDSFGQHCSTALNLSSTVCWITNKPHVFGYPQNINVLANQSHNKNIHRVDSIFQSDNWEGTFNHYYPYNNDEVFDVNLILDTII